MYLFAEWALGTDQNYKQDIFFLYPETKDKIMPESCLQITFTLHLGRDFCTIISFMFKSIGF